MNNSLRKSGKIRKLHKDLSALKKYLEYIKDSSLLKEVVSKIAEAQDLSLSEQIKLWKQIKNILEHQNLDLVRKHLEDFDNLFEEFLKKLIKLRHIKGVEKLISDAHRQMNQSDKPDSELTIVGVFNEVDSNLRLLEAGFTLHEIGMTSNQQKPNIISQDGSNLLTTDFAVCDGNAPRDSKLVQLKRLHLYNGGFKADDDLVQLAINQGNAWFNLDTNRVYENKKTNEPKILVELPNGNFASCEVDVVAKKKGIEKPIYIEHKSDFKAIFLKNSLQSPQLRKGKLLQLEKHIILSKAHEAVPAIMADFSDIYNQDETVKFKDPDFKRLSNLVLYFDSQYPEEEGFTKLMILDETGKDISALFRQAA